jgi:acyl-protein synthetase LuxE
MRDTALESELLALFSRGVGDGSTDRALLSEERFNDLALRVFRHQYEGSRVLRAFWDRRGATPEAVRQWAEIPGIPTAAFKEAPLCAFPPDEAAAIFETSGTTAGGRPGRHYLRTLALYEASLLPTFEAFLLPDRRPIRMLNLGPNAEASPHSSLGHMMSRVMQRWGQRSAGGSSHHFQTEAGLDAEGFRAALRAAEAAGEPVCLLGTAFAFVHWLDSFPDEQYCLAPGSRLMDTGGTKGRVREMTPADLYAAYERVFGIPAEHLVNEYGMTELSSQYYDVTLRTGSGLDHPRPKAGPQWLRTLVVDPESLQPLPNGEAGLLLHFDLANLDSVLAVQTEDLGRQTLEGLRLLGRATGAEARGCSLAVEELMSAR